MLFHLNGTVSVILSNLSFQEGYPRFTTVPFQPVTDHWGQRTQCVYLWNDE